MLLNSRRLLGAAAGLMLLAPLVPATAATASAPRPAGRPVAPRMTHGQAVAALHRAKALANGQAAEQAVPGRGVDATPVLRDLSLALRSLDGAERRTALRILARPTDVGGDDLGPGALVQLDPSQVKTVDTGDGHFSVHYIPGTPNPLNDANNNADPAWVTTNVLPALERAWSTEVGTMGYRAPLSDTADGTPGNPDDKLDVYLANLGQYGIYGYCTTADPEPATLTDPAYCVIDNDFARSQFGGDPLDSLHATVAHEFFHAVQFSYDIGEDSWLMEGTAVWMEHQVYPGSRDYLQYLPISEIPYPYAPLDLADGYHEYSAFLFWQYLSERLGRQAVQDVWDKAAADNGNLYSLQALRQVVSAHQQDFTSFFATFARWNTLPPHSYKLRSTYAAQVKPDWTLNRTVSKSHPRVTTGYYLPHLSSVDALFHPSAKLGRRAKLRIALNLPNRSHGSAATVQVRHRDGSVSATSVRLTSTGAGSATVPFNPRKVRNVALVMTNASTAMHCGTGSNDSGTYSCLGSGVYDNNQAYRVSARLR